MSRFILTSITWRVDYHEEYFDELQAESEAVQDAVFDVVELLQRYGPQLGRPWCDTLKGSRYPNMKELRFTLPGGEWRIAFAFDPRRQAMLLVGGSKSGKNKRRFYRDLIGVAEKRYAAHLTSLNEERGDKR